MNQYRYICPKCKNPMIVEYLMSYPMQIKWYCRNCKWEHIDRKKDEELMLEVPEEWIKNKEN